jgi:hypothetical protein
VIPIVRETGDVIVVPVGPDSTAGRRDTASLVMIVQGIYFLVSGVWPLVAMHLFERVTGPKTDRWLVKTVGVLVSVIGTALVMAGVRGRSKPELDLLAAGSAAGLTAIDVIYVVDRRISPIYLLDAVAECGLMAAMWASRRYDASRARKA